VIQIKKNLDVYLGLKKRIKCLKKSKALYRAFRKKTDRIVEGTIIKNIVSQADFSD
jgi:hypothetical protein